jgi:hypothetical protein
MFNLAREDYQQKTFEANLTCNYFINIITQGRYRKKILKLRAKPKQTLFDNLIVQLHHNQALVALNRKKLNKNHNVN